MESFNKYLPVPFDNVNCFEVWFKLNEEIDYSSLGRIKYLNYHKMGIEFIQQPKKNDTYPKIHLNGESVFVHRVIWEAIHGKIPEGYEIDHINGVKDDNRPINLRCVTHLDNMRNQSTYQKVSNANKKRFKDPEYRKKHYAMLDYIHTNPEMKEYILNAVKKANSKPVLQIDKETGEVIKEWSSLREIERTLGFRHSYISDCCKGKYKQAYGYIWRYKNNGED